MKLDNFLLNWIHDHMTSTWMDSLMVFITDIGRTPGMSALVTVVVLWLLAYRRHRDAAFVVIANVSARLLNIGMKELFQRERPSLWESIAPEQSYSFPSGHAMGAAALATSVILVSMNTRAQRFALVVMPAFAFVMGFTRLYLGVHYPSDVLAGWMIGTAWVAALHLVMIRRPMQGRGRGQVPPGQLPGE